MSKLSVSESIAFFGVWKIFSLLLVLPASNATSEKSFSALRLINTYLRTSMTEGWLNDSIILHVRKVRVDRVDLDNLMFQVERKN